MKLTTFTDYSLRMLIYLAAQDRRVTIAEVARAYDISEHHLVKIAHFLGKAGWLSNLRGKGGGLELARRPDAINIGRLVRECEGEAQLAACFREDAPPCAIAGCCRMQPVLAQALESFYAVLDRHTLADLVPPASELAPLLFLHREAHAGRPA